MTIILTFEGKCIQYFMVLLISWNMLNHFAGQLAIRVRFIITYM
jgi:hypothetical protein